MKPDFLTRLLLILTFPLLLSGCNAVLLKSSYGNYYSRLAPERYEPEIARLTALTDENSPSYTPSYHLYLSLLYSSYNNPSRDYSKALEQMEKYLLVDAAGASSYEVRNIHSLLKEINNTEKFSAGVAEGLKEIEIGTLKLKEKNESLAAQNKKQQQEMQQKEVTIVELTKKIDELNETINKLKNLDMELEKKRKSFRE